MDTWTKLLLAATALAVTGYFGLIYGGCAFDPDCHLRACHNQRQICGVTYQSDVRQPR